MFWRWFRQFDLGARCLILFNKFINFFDFEENLSFIYIDFIEFLDNLNFLIFPANYCRLIVFCVEASEESRKQMFICVIKIKFEFLKQILILSPREEIDDVIFDNVVNIVFFCYRIINCFNTCLQNVFEYFRFYFIRLELFLFEQFINVDILFENFVDMFVYYR